MLKKLLIGILVVGIGALAVLWIGAATSLDYGRTYSREAAQLPSFAADLATAAQPALFRVAANGFDFRTRAAGFPGSRGNVILLHGFPESSIMYQSTLQALAEAGYAAIAFDQRGYSPGARPESLESYRIDNLIADVRAVADAVGFDEFHLVGHDWGAVVGWTLVMSDATPVRSWSALSIPHIAAYTEAMANDPDQQQRSGYVAFFQTPWVPEVVFGFNRFNMLKSSVYGEHGEAATSEYLRLFSEPGALTAALNWYRATELTNAGSQFDPQIDIPVLFVWGGSDPVVGQAALEAQRALFSGPFREVELDTGHWLMETRGAATDAAILSHLSSVDSYDSAAQP